MERHGIRIDGTVYALALMGSDIYAGGDFTGAVGVAKTSSIARWDGASWRAVGEGVRGSVYALAAGATSSDLFLGGNILNVGNIDEADFIARWDGTQWHALGSGLNGTVEAMTTSGSDLYVAGYFTDAGGVIGADGVARWDGIAWHAVIDKGSAAVRTLAAKPDGSAIFLGGDSFFGRTTLSKSFEISDHGSVSVVADTTGSVHVLYPTPRDGLVVRTFNAATTTWTQPTPVTAETVVSSTLTYDPDAGRLAVFWENGAQVRMRSAAAPFDYNAWSSAKSTTLDDSPPLSGVSVAAWASSAYPLLSWTVGDVAPCGIYVFDAACSSAQSLCPVVTSKPQTRFLLGVPYHYDEDGKAEASGHQPIAWRKLVGPTTMTITNDGVIAWTPSQLGPVVVVLEASNDDGAVAQRFIVNRPESQAPHFVDDANRLATLAKPYYYNTSGTISIEGLASGEIVAVTAISAPEGFAVNTLTHQVGWMPRSTGLYDVVLALTNWQSSVPWDTLAYSIRVAEKSQGTGIVAAATITPAAGPAPLEVALDASESRGTDGSPIAQYVWDLETGATLQTGKPVIRYVYPEALGAMVTLEVRDVLGYSATTKVPVSVRSQEGRIPPVVTATADVVFGVAPLTVHFSCEASDPDGDSSSLVYLWQVSNGATFDTCSFDYTFNMVGSYRIRLTAQDASGLMGVDSVPVVVLLPDSESIPPVARIIFGVTKNDSGADVLYEASGKDPDGIITKRSWLFSDGNTSEEVSIGKLYSQAGVYDARLEVEDNAGLKGHDQVSIYVASLDGKMPPRIVSSPYLSAKVGQAYQYDTDGMVAAQGTRPLFWTLGRILNGELLNAPAGMLIHPTTGVVTWTPSAEQAGDHTVTLVVQNSVGPNRQEFVVHVDGEDSATATTKKDEGCGCSQNARSPAAAILWLSAGLLLHLTRRRRSGHTIAVVVGMGLLPALQACGVETTESLLSSGRANANASVYTSALDELLPAAVLKLETGLGSDSSVADDHYEVNENQTLYEPTPGVAANDPAAELKGFSVQLREGTAHGRLGLRADGSFMYEPKADFVGTDSFTYRASVYGKLAGEAVVTLAVGPIPMAFDDAYETDEDTPLTILAAGVLENDRSISAERPTARLVTGATNGRLVLNADGSFYYSPSPNYFGTDGFTYVAADRKYASPPAHVTIAVHPIADFPQARKAYYETNHDTRLNVDSTKGLLANVYSPETDVEFTAFVKKHPSTAKSSSVPTARSPTRQITTIAGLIRSCTQCRSPTPSMAYHRTSNPIRHPFLSR